MSAIVYQQEINSVSYNPTDVDKEGVCGNRSRTLTASTRDTTVKPKHSAEPINPMIHAKALAHEQSSLQKDSSPEPHPHNFDIKHMHSLKCAQTLQTEKAMEYQLGLVSYPKDCEVYSENNMIL